MGSSYTFLDLVTMPSGSWANWFAGIFSALAVGVAISLHFLKERKDRKAQEREKKVIAIHIGHKAVRLLNSFHDIYRHVWAEADKNMVGFTGEVELHRSIFAMTGLEIEYSLDLSEAEISLLFEMGAPEFLMEYGVVFGRYKSLVLAMQEYKSEYQARMKSMPPPDIVSGNQLSFRMTKEQMMQSIPSSLILEGLIKSAREMSLEGVRSSLRLVHTHRKNIEDHFGKSLFGFESDEDVGDLSNLGQEIPR